MTARSDDERFAELIAAEFAEDVTTSPVPTEGPRDKPPSSPPTPPTASGFRTWTPAEEPEEDFVPPPLAPARPWHGQTRLAVGLIVASLLAVGVSGLGVSLSPLVAVAAGASFFAGTALLLYRLTKQPPPDDNGAIL